MDHLILVLVSGVASGAIYGLMGLGLVIIYRATDVVNFALASLATLGLYVAITVHGQRGRASRSACVAAVAAAVVAGLLVREVVIRPLGRGQLFAALVLTMGVALIVESVVSDGLGHRAAGVPQPGRRHRADRVVRDRRRRAC